MNEVKVNKNMTPTKNKRALSLFFFVSLLSQVFSFSTDAIPRVVRPLTKNTKHNNNIVPKLLKLRAGDQVNVDDATEKKKVSSMAVLPFVNAAQMFGKQYGKYLNTNPIMTKSVTAGLIFGLSDYTAQKLETGETKMDWTRIITASLVGLLYFGPAAHYWYEWIFKLIPGAGLISTLKKATLGQLVFGPSFTCIFFATSLMQSGSFSLGTWAQKIKSDLPGAW